jgi:hypothetical protein
MDLIGTWLYHFGSPCLDGVMSSVVDNEFWPEMMCVTSGPQYLLGCVKF